VSDLFKWLFMRWIVYCQLALVILEKKCFREHLTSFNTDFASILPRTSFTLPRWILGQCTGDKERLKEKQWHYRSDTHPLSEVPRQTALRSYQSTDMESAHQEPAKVTLSHSEESPASTLAEHHYEIFTGVTKKHSVDLRHDSHEKGWRANGCR
jgi:hypothetical protein